MTVNEKDIETEVAEMLDEIKDEEQQKFDNADGGIFTDDDVPHYVVRRLYNRTYEYQILSWTFLY